MNRGDPSGRAHNQLAAEHVFGRELVEQRRHFRQQRCRQERMDPPHSARGSESTVGGLAKVHFALRRLGFGDTEARRAVAEVRGLGELTLEEMLRAALLAATRAA
jgi:hypothetical protein